MHKLTLGIAGVTLLLPIGVFAEPIYRSENLSVAGIHSSAVCRIVNGDKPCAQRDVAARKPVSGLAAVLSGKADLAVVDATSVTPDMPLEVLFYTSTKKDRVLVSRSGLRREDGRHVIESFLRFFSSDGQRGIPDALVKLVRLPQINWPPAFQPYVQFEQPYKLNAGVADHFMDGLAGPLTIAYEYSSCNRKTKSCVSVFDMPVENYKASQVAGAVGMPIAPYLIEALKSSDDNRVMKAARALGEIWPADPATLSPPLRQSVAHRNLEVREQAIIALGTIAPPQLETLLLLEQVASEKPEPRPTLADGSHGFGGGTSSLKQDPIAVVAARALARLDEHRALTFLSKLVNSEDSGHQATAVQGLSAIIALAYQEKAESQTARSRHRPTIDELSQAAREALAVLKTADVDGDAARQVADTLTRFQPEATPSASVLLLALDLSNSKEVCVTHDEGTKFCDFPAVRSALYKLRAMGPAAARPEVYDGLRHVLRNGGRAERRIAVDVISGLTAAADFPAPLGRSLLTVPLDENNSEALPRAWASLAIHQPAFAKAAVQSLETALKSGKAWGTRSAALTGLALVVKHGGPDADRIADELVAAAEQDTDAHARAYMLPPLADMGDRAHKAVPLLIASLPHSRDAAAQPGMPAQAPGTSVDYDIGWKAGEAIEKLSFGSPEIVPAIERSYHSDLAAASCDFGLYRLSHLTQLARAHRARSPDQSALLEPTRLLLARDDDSCRQTAMRLLGEIGPQADAAVPEMAHVLSHTDPRKNGPFFEALKSIGTPVATKAAEKYAQWNPEGSTKQEEPRDLAEAADELFALQPDYTKAQLHVLAVGHAESSKSAIVESVEVNVDYPRAPIMLVLMGKESLQWSVKTAKGTRVIAAWFDGPARQRIGQVPPDVAYAGNVETRDSISRIQFAETTSDLSRDTKRFTGKQVDSTHLLPSVRRIELNAATIAAAQMNDPARQALLQSQRAESDRLATYGRSYPPELIQGLGSVGSELTGRNTSGKPESEPLDVSLEAHDAYALKNTRKTKRASGKFARFGWWDYGACHGEDQWTCGALSVGSVGCEASFPACKSGKAVAIDSYPGDNKCVIAWWKWVCK